MRERLIYGEPQSSRPNVTWKVGGPWGGGGGRGRRARSKICRPSNITAPPPPPPPHCLIPVSATGCYLCGGWRRLGGGGGNHTPQILQCYTFSIPEGHQSSPCPLLTTPPALHTSHPPLAPYLPHHQPFHTSTSSLALVICACRYLGSC